MNIYNPNAKANIRQDDFYIGDHFVAGVNKSMDFEINSVTMTAEQAGKFAGYIKKCQEVGLICG